MTIVFFIYDRVLGVGGGSKSSEARGGEELAPKVAPRRLGLLTTKIGDFLLNL